MSFVRFLAMGHRFPFALFVVICFVFCFSANSTEIWRAEPISAGWNTEIAVSIGGNLPTPRAVRVDCLGFVPTPEPIFILEYFPQNELPPGFIDFTAVVEDPDVQPIIIVQMPNGLFLCSDRENRQLRAGAIPGAYRVWIASDMSISMPVAGVLEIQHTPIRRRS